MDDITAALAAQDAELARLLAGRTEDDWHRPTPCEGWDVADVVLHVAQTNELAVASASDTFPEVAADLSRGPEGSNVDDAAAAMVEQQRGASGTELLGRWQSSAERFLEVVDGADLHRRVTWVAGQLSLRTLVTTRLSETWIHTTDVADALDVSLEPTDRLRFVARLAWRTLPYAFASAGVELHGPVAFELQGPDGREWRYVPDEAPVTIVHGPGSELCLVAARRLLPSETDLRAEGPDADLVLELVRTYA